MLHALLILLPWGVQIRTSVQEEDTVIITTSHGAFQPIFNASTLLTTYVGSKQVIISYIP